MVFHTRMEIQNGAGLAAAPSRALDLAEIVRDERSEASSPSVKSVRRRSLEARGASYAGSEHRAKLAHSDGISSLSRSQILV
jgi:hypothetical protein